MGKRLVPHNRNLPLIKQISDKWEILFCLLFVYSKNSFSCRGYFIGDAINCDNGRYWSMESQNVEYKQSWKDEYLKWICGFANAQGGTLYIGIDENGNVVGIDNAKYLLENLPNKCIQTTGIVPDIENLTQKGKAYLAIHIKASEQPVAFNGKYYLRSGSTLQELTGNALTDFLLRRTNTSWDMHIVQNATLEDIDSKAVNYFVEVAVEAKRLDKSARKGTTEDILR